VVFSQKITRRNIVDRTKSPAFIAINTARRNLRELFNLDDVRYKKEGDISIGLRKNWIIVENAKRPSI
jgi:hypothetical protein